MQLLRTYGVKRPPFPFAPHGERSIARAYVKAFANARSLIYIEDQYLWSKDVARVLADALRRNPALTVIAVVPRYTDSEGPLEGPPTRIGQLEAVAMLRRAAPKRFGVFDVENAAGTPIYVHAKVCIVDDVWFTCGSDNFNRRSWTTDSELTCAVLDETRDERRTRADDSPAEAPRRLARDLRIGLWAEHLQLDPGEPRLIDGAAGLELWTQSAAALDAWHRGGGTGPRPIGRVRAHRPEPIGRLQRVWARPLNRIAVDPDGRPRSIRGTSTL
ncbi:MAG: phospholipase D-like domain-containing protein [Amnibacterium sp.]